MGEYRLRLFINGGSDHSKLAVKRIKSICDQELGCPYRLDIIDVMDDPEAAQDARIIATPTLIKTQPPPLRRIIGDFSDKQQVLLGLDVMPSSPSDAR